MDSTPHREGPGGGGGGATLARGASIGRFVVLELLGRGGMGEVYAAHDPELNRNVAIKLLRSGGNSDSPDGRLRLIREAQAIARVAHPNVVVVYDVGTSGGRVFIAMELIEGYTLRYWALARTRSWMEMLEVFVAAGRGLVAAHERGLVHRDFKPDNVMITKDGLVRVMDFGIVQVGGEADHAGEGVPPVALASAPREPAPDSGAREDQFATRPIHARSVVAPSAGPSTAFSIRLTHTGATLGTPAYMAPEQFRGEVTDARTDQFSFCVALYEILYDQRPFQGSTIDELAAAVIAGAVREPPAGAVPDWIRDAVLRGLSPDPAARWPSMTALLAELERPELAKRRRFAAAAAAKLADVWPMPGSAGDGPARAEMRQAFFVSGRLYAAKAYQSASQILDSYARRWSDLYVEACEATHVRGEQSTEVLDLRMECLQQGLADLAALVRQFRSATAQVVERAVSAANALGTLERCENIELLRAVVRPPVDAATRESVDGLRARLADVRALTRVGRCNDGRDAVLSLVLEARELGYQPLLVEALLAHCRLAEEQGATEDAARMGREALMTAVACRHEEVAAEVATQLVGYETLSAAPSEANFLNAEIWIELAEALLRRIGGHEVLWGWLLNNRAGVRYLQGRMDEGYADMQAAVTTKVAALGPDHPDVGISICGVAVVLSELCRHAESVEHGRRAVEIVGAGLGPDHPRTAWSLVNYSEFLSNTFSWAPAADAASRALAIFEREAEPSGLFVFLGLAALGIAHLGAGRIPEALPILERAEGLCDTQAPSASYRGRVRFALARAQWEAGADRPRAIALATKARLDCQESPRTPLARDELARVTAWLAEVGRGSG